MWPNPNYWKGKPKLDQIQIKFVPDPETAKAALKTGDVDFVPDFAEFDSWRTCPPSSPRSTLVWMPVPSSSITSSIWA